MDLNREQSQNYYELLGVSLNATLEDIRSAYHEISRIYHPDSNYYSDIAPKKPTSDQLELYKSITAAYNTLCDNERRAEYDNKLRRMTLGLKSWEDTNHDFFDKNQKMYSSTRRRQNTLGKFGVVGTQVLTEQDRIALLADAAEKARINLGPVARPAKKPRVSRQHLILLQTIGSIIAVILWGIVYFLP